MDDVIVVSASGMAGYGNSNLIETRIFNDRLVVVGDGVTEPCEGAGLMAPRVGIAASHQSNAIVDIILKGMKV